MRAAPRWVSEKALLLLHEASLGEFGGVAFLAIGVFLTVNGYRLAAGSGLK